MAPPQWVQIRFSKYTVKVFSQKGQRNRWAVAKKAGEADKACPSQVAELPFAFFFARLGQSGLMKVSANPYHPLHRTPVSSSLGSPGPNPGPPPGRQDRIKLSNPGILGAAAAGLYGGSAFPLIGSAVAAATQNPLQLASALVGGAVVGGLLGGGIGGIHRQSQAPGVALSTGPLRGLSPPKQSRSARLPRPAPAPRVLRG
jgi:hypothetical protein